MFRRLLNFLRKPFLGLPDSVQPIVIRELDDMESIHQDFTNQGFSVIVLRPEHTVTLRPHLTGNHLSRSAPDATSTDRTASRSAGFFHDYGNWLDSRGGVFQYRWCRRCNKKKRRSVSW
ncbi:Uncharacterised protein [Mycobacteroides abscessus subsp. abscessus]|nr:Uncharacterised protein [Mycobacteroides abscessus subsp. abscessus]